LIFKSKKVEKKLDSASNYFEKHGKFKNLKPEEVPNNAPIK